MRVVCAWCGVVLSDASGPVSHGICPSCSLTVERAFHIAAAKKKRPSSKRRDREHRVPTLPLPGFFSPRSA